MKSRLLKILNISFLVFGVALLIGLLVRLDLDEIGGYIVQVGWSFLWAFLAYTLSNFATTLSWQAAINPAESRASFLNLLSAFWAGHAINQLTPTASFGEILRGTILKGRVQGEEIVASLISMNFLNMISTQTFTLLGPIICLLFTDLPVPMLLSLFGIAVAFFIPVVLVYLLLRMGLTHRIVWLATKIPLIRPRNPDNLLQKAKSIDVRIREFRTKRPGGFYASLIWLYIARLCQVLEVWILLLAFMPEHPVASALLLAFVIQTAAQLIVWLMTFIPGQVGVVEGGGALVFKLLGFDPVVGFSLFLVRRLRWLLGITVGLLLGFRLGTKSPRSAFRAGEKSVKP